MTPRILPTLALVSALGAAGLIAVRADAQQPPPGPGGPGHDDRYDGPGRMGRGGFDGPRRGGPMGRVTPADRAAFLDARIAAVKAGLQLSPDQDKMWPAVESAVRDAMAKRQAMAEQRRSEPPPTDPIEAMRRRADAAAQRGDTLHKIVAAAQPLYASLSDDQKRRLPLLLRAGRRPHAMMMRRMHEGWREGMGGDRERAGGRDREDFAGPRDRGSMDEMERPHRNDGARGPRDDGGRDDDESL